MPAILSVETFATIGYQLHIGMCSETDAASMEVHLAGVQHKRVYNTCARWWHLSDLDRPVLSHYGATIASYKDAVWPTLKRPSYLLPCYWNGATHPGEWSLGLLLCCNARAGVFYMDW